jgi:predicted nucleic acid-binding protein
VILVDTSVWIDVFRDASGGGRRKGLNEGLQGDEVVLSRFCQLELLRLPRSHRLGTAENKRKAESTSLLIISLGSAISVRALFERIFAEPIRRNSRSRLC